jgi:hypothetical protein
MYLGFRTGLRLGMQVSKGQLPPKIDPISTVKKATEPKDTFVDGLLKGHANMMAYNGDPPKEG